MTYNQALELTYLGEEGKIALLHLGPEISERGYLYFYEISGFKFMEIPGTSRIVLL